MSDGETPSIKHMREQMAGFRQLLESGLPMDAGKREDLQRQLDEVSAQLDEIVGVPARFNECFSSEGWLAHGAFPIPIMQEAIAALDADGLEAANAILMNYYGPENLADRIHWLRGAEPLRLRSRLIEAAFEDYKAGRHHAVVPLLLMLMDGAVNDTVGVGLHARDIDLDVWDSLTTADGAIYDIKAIFQRSRKKTRAEQISLPYRHGILHGMDLGYDNAVVSAKCWCFMFVVADWISSKQSEAARRERFANDTRPPRLSEIRATMARTEATKKAVAAWSPRDISSDYVESLNGGSAPEKDTPEDAALRFLDLWAARNYGHMAGMHSPTLVPNSRTLPRDLRDQIGHIDIESHVLENIVDEAPAISEVHCILNPESSDALKCRLRMIYQGPDGQASVPGMDDGSWLVVLFNTEPV